MPVHRFTIGGSTVEGFRVTPEGAVRDFRGTLRNFYNDLASASLAARRKYRDSTITITSIKREKHRYEVELDDLMKIARPID